MTLGPAATARAGEGGPAVDTDVLALPHPEWLYHHLQVRGDPEAVAGFRAAAAGAGVIPWQQDLGPAAEDWFHLLAAPPAPQQRSLSLAGARTQEALWTTIGHLLDTFTPAECRSYLANSGYGFE